MDYILAAKQETLGGKYMVGVQINVATRDNRNLSDEEKSEISYLADKIYQLLLKGCAKADPEDVAAGQKETKDLLACFPLRCSYEEIPNGYSNGYYTVNRPWLKVSTYKGTVIIGWRKRVISIDWSQSNVKERANELFPDEDVTKDERLIHAWGYEKATEYLKKILL